jgi:hypothetical protein
VTPQYEPVTPGQAAENAATLLRELAEWEASRRAAAQAARREEMRSRLSARDQRRWEAAETRGRQKAELAAAEASARADAIVDRARFEARAAADSRRLAATAASLAREIARCAARSDAAGIDRILCAVRRTPALAPVLAGHAAVRSLIAPEASRAA